MNKELRKSFNELKTKCDTPEKRKAYNKLVKTFANKSITKDWLIDLIRSWISYHKPDYDTKEFVKLATNNNYKSLEIDLISELVSNDTDIENILANSKFATISDVNLYHILNFFLRLK